jgi:tripartite-type tricarboxylate transporter receptor subunit TctC
MSLGVASGLHRSGVVTKLLHAIAVAATLGAIGGAPAQNYPSRPITMGMPFAAGGPGDTLARILAERMGASLGQSVIVENITGAAGSIGAGRVARAPPDGYTLILGNWSTHVVNAAAYALTYDVINDFEPVSLVATQPVVIIARKSMPADDLKELIAWLKANPGKASAGNAGIGTASHVGAVFFQKETGTRLQLVPYRGGAPAMQDLLGGRTDLTFDLVANALPQMRAGSVKAYAVMAKSRLAAAPDLPTVDELGVPGLYVSLWNALWAPRGTPQDVIGRLNAAVVEALADPAVHQRLAGLGHDFFPRDQETPEALARYQKAEIEKWWPIIKAAGIKGE